MNENQTAFGQAEPLFENIARETPADSRLVDPAMAQQRKRRRLIIIAVGLVFVFCLLLGLLLLRGRSQPAPVPAVTPNKTQPVKSSDLQKRYAEVKADLDKADPTVEVLPFPAVDMGLSLFKLKK